MLRQLDLDTISKSDEGRNKAAFDLHLKKCMDDCVDRPGSDQARTLTLTLSIIPLQDEHGNCDDVQIEFEVGSKMPKHRSRPLACKVRKIKGESQLVFNDMSEDNPDQRTLDEQSPGFLPKQHGSGNDAA